eukprot:scaffold34712_cov66-Cyclotella_meneghiniana.AAC.5
MIVTLELPHIQVKQTLKLDPTKIAILDLFIITELRRKQVSTCGVDNEKANLELSLFPHSTVSLELTLLSLKLTPPSPSQGFYGVSVCCASSLTA